MKILFIGSKRFDYVQDLSYSGLVKILGTKNVIEYQWNPKYHFKLKEYPKNLGYQPGFPLKGIFRRKTDYDMVLVASNKPDAIKAYLALVQRIPAKVPVVFVDGGDRPELGGDIVRTSGQALHDAFFGARELDFVFKREMLKEAAYPAHVFPFPISVNLDRIPKSLATSKKYEVAFWAGAGSHPIRQRVFERLEGQFDCQANGTLPNQSLGKFAATRVSLNFRGGGWDTLRYWEIPATGAFMLSQPPGILIPNDFQDRQHVVHCQEDLSDLLDLCVYYLRHESEREAIARAGHEHMLRFHTDRARAQFLLETVGR